MKLGEGIRLFSTNIGVLVGPLLNQPFTLDMHNMCEPRVHLNCSEDNSMEVNNTFLYLSDLDLTDNVDPLLYIISWYYSWNVHMKLKM